MSKFYNLLPKISLWVLMLVSVVAFALIFIGGSIDPTAEYKEPVFTDVLLIWIAIILLLALAVTLIFACIQLVKGFISSPMSALKSLIGPLLLVALLLFGFFGANDFAFMTNDDLPTFDGTITLFTNQLTNACMVAIGVLAIIAILLIIFANAFKSKVKDA